MRSYPKDLVCKTMSALLSAGRSSAVCPQLNLLTLHRDQARPALLTINSVVHGIMGSSWLALTAGLSYCWPSALLVDRKQPHDQRRPVSGWALGACFAGWNEGEALSESLKDKELYRDPPDSGKEKVKK